MEGSDYPTQTNGLQERPDGALTKSEGATLDKVKAVVSEKLHGAATALREKSQTFGGKGAAQYGNQAAEWLNRSANYIEEINPHQIKSDIGNQVRHNPGRSLLVAAGIGLVLGTLLRRR